MQNYIGCFRFSFDPYHLKTTIEKEFSDFKFKSTAMSQADNRGPAYLRGGQSGEGKKPYEPIVDF